MVVRFDRVVDSIDRRPREVIRASPQSGGYANEQQEAEILASRRELKQTIANGTAKKVMFRI